MVERRVHGMTSCEVDGRSQSLLLFEVTVATRLIVTCCVKLRSAFASLDIKPHIAVLLLLEYIIIIITHTPQSRRQSTHISHAVILGATGDSKPRLAIKMSFGMV